ncbi:MAG: UDP-N-acetylglucosamine 2-epimerase (non-hydrolyzing) [Euryarchaeota archaeon]|nr:UDP-N-acetylglucosamine 2-epimerase (non-hydrolyzing) [Euryarchaeota archaeon]
MRALVVASTRPEVIKLSPVMRELEARGVEYTFVTTGQHYDDELFWSFIRDLRLRQPEYNVEVGSGSHAYQTARALEALEEIILKEKPSAVIAEGDTNSVLSCALACAKLHVAFAHVEAGLRSFDRTMPEEVNRIIADHVSEVLFAPTERAALNLIEEGIPPEKIFIVGNTIVDATLQNLEIAREKSRILEAVPEDFLLLTLHRAENVDSKERLSGIMEALFELRERVVFPVHPRTRQRLEEFGLLKRAEEELHLLPPVGYLDFLMLLSRAKLVLTDSGGVQEEAIVLHTPCVTLRTSTERPETIEAGGNVLAGVEKAGILRTVGRILGDERVYQAMRRAQNPFGGGDSGRRIVDTLIKLEEEGRLEIAPPGRVLRRKRREFMRVDSSLAGKRIGELPFQVVRVIEAGRARFPYPELRLREGQMIEVVRED